jgi:hypothetical protein
LHARVEINPVVELAAALADEGEVQGVEEAQAAADVGGGFTFREVPRGRWDSLSHSSVDDGEVTGDSRDQECRDIPAKLGTA